MNHSEYKPSDTAMPRRASMKLNIAALLAAGAVCFMSSSPAQAQESWRGLDVPHYTNATDVTISKDEDEYEIYFQSKDSEKAVFDFYRNYLEKQGFKVTKTKTKKHGYKANMVRGQGGPDDRVELDVKDEHGRHKVEIEFDD